MFSYEAGAILAFLLWLYSNIMLIVSINSQFEKNLNKIGLRLSWVTVTPTPMEAADLRRSTAAKVFRFMLIAGFGFFWLFLSWLYVLIWIGAFIYRTSKDFGAPQSVKEVRWRMRNTEMTFDQLVRGMMIVGGEDESNFEFRRGEILKDMRERGLDVKA